MKTRFVTEGQTRLEVPDPECFRTRTGDYVPSLTSVFYNPRMELCRDISVSAVQVLARELVGLRICDPLAGVGARGVRYAKEVEGVSNALVNDRSSGAFGLIKRNTEINELTSLIVAHNEDANALLWGNRGRFNFVDLDPFGSPAPFIDAACSALARKGMLAMTATDTAPLSGTHARACLRKYGAKPLKTEYCHELGVRILVGFCQRVAGKHDLALNPILAHATLHYFRIYLRAQKGAQRTDDVLKQQGYVSHCYACGRRVLSRKLVPELPTTCECGNQFSHAGPLLIGKLMDLEFIQKVLSDLREKKFKLAQEEFALLSRCAEEAEGPPTFYEMNEVAKRVGVSTPKIVKVVAGLRKQRYFASRTHFSGTGFRTDAPFDIIIGMFRSL